MKNQNITWAIIMRPGLSVWKRVGVLEGALSISNIQKLLMIRDIYIDPLEASEAFELDRDPNFDA